MPPLSEPDTAEAEAFLAEMLLIYPVLGVQVFQKADEQPSTSVVLHLTGKGTKAIGLETPDGFVVKAGALARPDVVPSIHAYGVQLRGALIETGLFVPDGNHLRLTEDYLFASPSSAAMVMLGRTSNGRVEWRTADRKAPKALQEEATGVTAEPADAPVGVSPAGPPASAISATSLGEFRQDPLEAATGIEPGAQGFAVSVWGGPPLSGRIHNRSSQRYPDGGGPRGTWADVWLACGWAAR